MRTPFLIALVVAVVFGSFGLRPDLAGAQSTPQPSDLGRAIAAQEKHTPALLNVPGIAGTGVGLNAQGRAVIRIYLERDDVVTPPSLETVPVERRVTGRFEARCYQAECPRPVPLGVSVGHPAITAGTIGARVRKPDGTVYALSNNHVLANSNNATIGDSALQPGPYDGGTDPANKIGALAAFKTIVFSGGTNDMDAAIASVTPAMLGNRTYSGYTPTSTPVDATIGMPVKKEGRTTGVTTGNIAEINATIAVCYQPRGLFQCAKSATFVNQLTIGGGSFSAGGDSGSLIVTDSGYQPVGLLFAGSSTNTIANPIKPVLAHFGVTIDNSASAGDTEPPSQPTNLSATAVGGSQINLSWTAANDNIGVAYYQVYRGPTLIATVNHPTVQYQDTGLTPNTAYQYTVKARDAVGNQSLASDPAGATTLAGPAITLSVTGSKVRGNNQATLSWTGTAATNVDVYRNNAKIVTTPNSGSYTDTSIGRGGGSFIYKVCEAATTICSNEVTTIF
jgi:hypothetical protein